SQLVLDCGRDRRHAFEIDPLARPAVMFRTPGSLSFDRNALVLESPCGDVASAGKPHTVVPLGVFHALLDDRLQGRSAGNVTMECNLHPFRSVSSLSLSETHARTYWWCNPPKTGTASVWPMGCTGRGIVASFFSDKCVRTSL